MRPPRSKSLPAHIHDNFPTSFEAT